MSEEDIFSLPNFYFNLMEETHTHTHTHTHTTGFLVILSKIGATSKGPILFIIRDSLFDPKQGCFSDWKKKNGQAGKGIIVHVNVDRQALAFFFEDFELEVGSDQQCPYQPKYILMEWCMVNGLKPPPSDGI
jgi:hypothetical protein